MATAVTCPRSDTIYLLKDLEDKKDAEDERLTTQYHLLKARIGRTSPVPPEIDLSSVSNVLDVAAGNCVWILDVVSRPEVKKRIRVPSSGKDEKIKLYACDIGLGKFPPKEKTDKLGITTFIQDVTKPLPDHMHDMFDLIHMSALVGALSDSQWKSALKNLRNALKPGGYLLLFDYNAALYPTEQSMPPASWKFGASEVLRLNPSHFLHTHHHVLSTAIIPVFHFVPDLAHTLPNFVKEACMEVVKQTPVIFPLGRAAIDDGSVSEHLVKGYQQDFMTFFRATIEFFLKHASITFINPLTGTDFVEDDIVRFIEWFEDRLEDEGAYSCWFELITRKPIRD